MTPAQLDHLRRIDAHCAKRIAFYGNDQRFPAIPDCLTQDAEAGWKATRAVIQTLLNCNPVTGTGSPSSLLLESVLAAFPNV